MAKPGLWTFAIEAGDLDQKVTVSCANSFDVSRRFDVDKPELFPGPTYDTYGSWRPQSVIEVNGTDCPTGTEASVSLGGRAGFRQKLHASIDEFGNWLVLLPADAPAGDIVATATCGDITYGRLLIAANERAPAANP